MAATCVTLAVKAVEVAWAAVEVAWAAAVTPAKAKATVVVVFVQ